MMRLKYAEEIVRTLRDKGHDTYFVGGCVRDMLMNIEPVDYDIATGAPPEEVVKIFPRTEPIGSRFGVILVIHHGIPFEVATFRADQSYSDGRRPTAVVFTNSIDDVERRDFTINGLLYDPIEDQVIDHVGGMVDIEQRVVRAIGNPRKRFDEDKLRILRAIRFGARLGYTIEEETWQAVVTMAPSIHQVSAERIRDELIRILTEGQAASGVRMLAQSGLLGEILPEVDWTDYLEKCLAKLRVGEKPDFAAGVLFHRSGVEQARSIVSRLRFSNAEIKQITAFVREQCRFSDVRHMSMAPLKRFLRTHRFEDHLRLYKIATLAADGDLNNYDHVKSCLDEWSSIDFHPEPLISGEDLISFGLDPDPIFKDILITVEDEQLEGRLMTREHALDFVRRRYVEREY